MKKTLIICLLLLGCQTKSEEKPEIPDLSSLTKIENLSFPQWMEGGWTNSFESDLNKSFHITFLKHSATIVRGLPLSQKEVRTPYSDYNLEEEISDSTYIIRLTKNGDSAIYRFKRTQPEWEDTPALACSFDTKEKSGAAFLVLTLIR